MDIRRMLTYTDNCRQRLQETLAAHPEAFDAPFETIGEHKTIHALIAHCIGAEQRWVEKRIHNLPGSVRYEDCAAGTLSGLFTDWNNIRAKTHAVIDDGHSAAHAPQLHHEIAFTLSDGGYTEMLTVEECLFQIFNHQTFHLGQISLALQQMGIDPPNFDYVLLHREPDEE